MVTLLPAWAAYYHTKQTSFRIEQRPCVYPSCLLCSPSLQLHWFLSIFSCFFPQVVLFQPHPSTPSCTLKILKKGNPFVWFIRSCLTWITLLPIFFKSSIYASFSMLSVSIFCCYYRPPEPECFMPKTNFLQCWKVFKSKAEEKHLVWGSVPWGCSVESWGREGQDRVRKVARQFPLITKPFQGWRDCSLVESI